MSANLIKPQSPLVILRRIYLDITKNHCAAKLIEYFNHWRKWKLKNHRTDWVYMPLKQIYEDLMREHSLHVIRRAIALLEDKGFLKRRNNPGNGQDKTYQYQLQVEALNQELNVSSECDQENPECRNEPSENTVEQHTQLQSSNIKISNIKSTKQVSTEENPEEIIKAYEEQLKIYGIYKLSWDGDNQIPNPRLKPILAALKEIPPDRAERSIKAFLGWIRNAKNVEDKYKAMYAAITRGWD